MTGLTFTIILTIVGITMALLYEYVGPFGFIALILVAAIINIYERHRDSRE